MSATRVLIFCLCLIVVATSHAADTGYPTGNSAGSDLYNYAMYKNNPTVNTTTAATLRTLLETHVTQLITATRWSPFHEWNAIKYSSLFFTERSEVFHALSLAYPYLSGTESTGLKGQVRTYLRSLWTSQQPYAGVDYSDLSLSSGMARNWHSVDSADYSTGAPWYGNPLGTAFTGRIIKLYPLYLFGQNTNSWDLVQAQYTTIKSAYTSISSTLASDVNNPNNNRNISSVIAFARIADNAGQTSDVTSALTKLQAMIATRIDQHATEGSSCGTSASCIYYTFSQDQHSEGVTEFYDLCPEAGRMLKDYRTTATTSIVNTVFGYAQGYWSVRGTEPMGEGEVFAPWLFTTQSYFNLFSYVQQVDFYQHCQMVDAAACKADVLYIERIVRAIEASGNQNWVSYSTEMTGWSDYVPPQPRIKPPILGIMVGIVY